MNKFYICQTWMHQNILLWPCCTQAAGIRERTGVKCSKSTHRYEKIFPSLDSWFDNLDMVVDFVHLCVNFGSSMTILTVWSSQLKTQCLTSQQRMLGDIIVFLLGPQSYHKNKSGRQQAHPKLAELPPRPQRILEIEKCMLYIKQIKICAEYRDMLPRPWLELSGTPGLNPKFQVCLAQFSGKNYQNFQ